MNLDEQLRAVLSLEADMQTAPPPDVQELISGGQDRRRRRNAVRVGIGIAAAVVLIGGGVYAVSQLDSEPHAVEPAETKVPPPYQDVNGGAMEPGTYRVAVGPGIAADLTFEGLDWKAGGYPLVTNNDVGYAGVGVYQPELLAGGSGCSSSWKGRPPAATTQDLAQQLSRLPQSALVEPVTAVQAFGRDAKHLQVRIDADCPAEVGYVVVEAAPGSRGIFYGGSEPVVIDFWVVDVDGSPVVVDLWRQDRASSELVDEATQAAESISFADVSN